MKNPQRACFLIKEYNEMENTSVTELIRLLERCYIDAMYSNNLSIANAICLSVSVARIALYMRSEQTN